MATAPMMPLWTDALIGDTTHLSTEQFGAYVLILIATWRNNGKPLPDDDQQLARICRLSAYKWREKVRPILQRFFEINSTGWHQKRLEIEWERTTEILAKRRASASAGGKAAAASKEPSTRTLTKAKLKDSESLSNTESLDAAREGKKNEEQNPLARCARLKKPDFVRLKLLPKKHLRTFAPHRPDLLMGYWAATQLDPETEQPVDPAAFKQAIDGMTRLIELNKWPDPDAHRIRSWKSEHRIAA